MTYLVYPGATHQRFEHCLGVMEVATRIYDVVTNPRNIFQNESVREIVPEPGLVEYWRRVLRMAALCHDMGQLPFFHGPEDLLPKGTNHETLSLAIIRSDLMVQPGPDHDYLQRHYSDFLNGYQRQIEFVADCLASRDVKDLERLATALYITLEGGPPAERPTKLNALKPHVHIEDATKAVQELDAVVAFATKAGFATALPNATSLFMFMVAPV